MLSPWIPANRTASETQLALELPDAARLPRQAYIAREFELSR
jgi:hypothetical protein